MRAQRIVAARADVRARAAAAVDVAYRVASQRAVLAAGPRWAARANGCDRAARAARRAADAAAYHADRAVRLIDAVAADLPAGGRARRRALRLRTWRTWLAHWHAIMAYRAACGR